MALQVQAQANMFIFKYKNKTYIVKRVIQFILVLIFIFNQAFTLLATSFQHPKLGPNLIPEGLTEEEFEALQDNVIKFDEIQNRIEYYSPTYLNILDTASIAVDASIFGAGASEDSARKMDESANDLRDAINEMVKNKVPSEVIDGYRASLRSVNKARAGLAKAVNFSNNVSNNLNVRHAKFMLTKSLESAYLGYLQLEEYAKLSQKQEDLYLKIYNLLKKNVKNGLSTELDVELAKVEYESAKSSKEVLLTNKQNVLNQLKNLLGYKLSDDIVLIPPEVDLEYFYAINLDKDYDMACYSNDTYENARKEGPKTKSESDIGIMDNRLNMIGEKVKSALEAAYTSCYAKSYLYLASTYQTEIYEIENKKIEKQFNSGLLSINDYLGLSLQNMALLLNITLTKYDFIQSLRDYEWGRYGFLDIN